MPKPPLFDFSWFPDFENSLVKLSQLATPEDWNYKSDPGRGNYPILYNYLHHTFGKVQSDGLITVKDDYCTFNTGLVTNNQEEIYAYFNKNRKYPDQTNVQWYFIDFRKKGEKDLLKFSSLPEPCNYINDPSDLIYDNRKELRVNLEHIVIDNKDRFPDAIKVFSNHQIILLLEGAIADTKKRIRRNYKTAIPQYFKGKIQLLLPLCILSKSKADLALAVEREDNTYRATTCLTLDMAINNARLIAKPDDEWLKY